MIFCSTCGKKNTDQARFCGKCGEKLVSIDSDRRRVRRNIDLFALSVKVVIIFIGILIGYFTLMGWETFLQVFMLFAGLGLTFGVFCDKHEWFILAFGVGVFMLVLNLWGYFTEFDPAYFWDIVMWVADLLVLYKWHNEEEE